MSKEQYIGVWMSVNDIQYQLGKKFEVFINYINKRIQNLDTIKCKYITRSWIMKKIVYITNTFCLQDKKNI